MEDIISGFVGDPFAFHVTDQLHALPLIFRNIDNMLFPGKIRGNFSKDVRFSRFPFMFRYGRRMRHFLLGFRKLFLGKKRWRIIHRNKMFGLGAEYLTLQPG